MADSSPLIIFTDLDGTLLDHQTYAFAPAAQALKAVQASATPLIFCSSKTRAEIEVWRTKLKNTHPFIVENGGAVFFPVHSPAPGSAKEKDDYSVVELGIPYNDLKTGFAQLKKRWGNAIRGFSEMNETEVGACTGLKEEDARRAREREYTEPFMFEGSQAELHQLQQVVAALNLRLTRGGRFYHLIADNDKGKAVRIAAESFRTKKPEIITVALGDSINDVPMLETVDIPIVVQKPDGSYDPVAAALPNIRKAPGIGPAGWNKAVLQLLNEHQVSKV